MKSAPSRQRWALSFADLALLLLGFFVLLQAKPDANHLSAGLRAAFGARPGAAFEQPARTLFEPGEAVLTRQGRATLQDFAHRAGGAGLIVSSHGTEAGTTRFDGWELAAARTAAVARTLTEAGIKQDKIAVAIDPAIGDGQTIQITRN
ncbi:MAG TPA: OmpA family protein [Sphingomonas sp.]|nr:OmpA family protein [Sphingomonas sp.]